MKITLKGLGNKIMYQIIKQKRKTVSIHINEDLEVIIKVPQNMKEKHIHELTKKHENWIQEALQKKQMQRQKKDWRITNQILYLGTYYAVCKLKGSYKGEPVTFKDDQFIIRTKTTDKEEEIAKHLEQFFREEARAILTKLTDYYADLLKVKYHKISIRKQKTRWGSCSTKGNISYNVKIICAPKDMIAYIVLHEVMHLKHFNHGSEFWREIAEVMPDYKQRRGYFKQFGQDFIL